MIDKSNTETQADLVRILKQVKKRSRWKGFESGDSADKFAGISLGSKENSDFKYGWSNHHCVICFDGERLHVKAAKILGGLVTRIRYHFERTCNDGFIVPQNIDAAMQREARIYERLRQEGFPSLESRQDLIRDQECNLLVNKVLLTKRIEGARHTIDLINDAAGTRKLVFAEHVSEMLGELHRQHGQIWCDAVLGNTLYNPKGELILYDFGFKPNDKYLSQFLMSKDFVSLCASAVFRTGLDPKLVVGTMIKAYNPDAAVKQSLKDSLDCDIACPPSAFFSDAAYFLPVYGLDCTIMTEMKKEILNNLS